MTKRTLKHTLIRSWIDRNGKGALAKLSLESGCSPSMIQKMVTGKYVSTPSIDKMDGLCRVTGHAIDELFPVCETEKESA